jgi:hypothetical protein
MPFGDFARLDGYDPDAAFPPGSPEDEARWAREAAAARLGLTRRQQGSGAERSERVMGTIADITKAVLDPIVTEATDYSRGRVAPSGPMTEEEAFRINRGNIGRVVPEMAMLRAPLRNPLGKVTQSELRGGTLYANAPQDQYWHGISAVKLPKPLAEYSSVHVPRAAMEGKTVNPESLLGKRLYPTISDTTVPNTYLQQIEGYKLPEPVKMSGGGRFADVIENKPDVWMSQSGPMKGLANRVGEISKRTGDEVVVAPTALSGTGGDYSHHVWSPLVDVLKDTKGISKAARNDFNAALRDVAPDFPGVNASRDRLQSYFEGAARTPRTAFAQIMDTRRFQDLGFPDVAAVRHAATDRELLHAPMGSSGFSTFRIDPNSVRPVSGHGTYSHGVSGENVGGLGVIAPPDIMFPDVMESLRLMSQASGKPLKKYTGRPDYYFAGRVPSELFGKPLAQSQLVDDKWLNTFGDYARRYKKVGGAAALASGMTLAEIAAAEERFGDLAEQSDYRED